MKLTQKQFTIALVTTLAAQASASWDDIPRAVDLTNPGFFKNVIQNAQVGGSVSDPAWKNDHLARIDFDYRNDTRKREENWRYRINEEGWIDGLDLLSLARPMERTLFDQRMQGQCVKGESGNLYREYLASSQEQAMSLLVMSRILDHEAMKRKLAPEVTEERVGLVVRSVLTQFAIQSKRVDFADRSNEELYSWLKGAAGSRPVALNIDWKFKDPSIAMMAEKAQEDGLPWKPARLEWRKLPDSWMTFRDDVRNQLQPAHRVLIRQKVWSQLVQEQNPTLPMDSLVAVTNQEIQKQYDMLRDSQFVEAQPLAAEVLDVVVSGQKASDFNTRFTQLLNENQEKLTRDLYAEASACGDTSSDSRARFMEKVLKMRKEVPQKIFAQVSGEYSTELATGQVSASISLRTINHDGVSAFPQGDSIEAKQVREVFNPVFATTSLFPRTQNTDANQSIRALVLVGMTPGKRVYRALTDPAVQQMLRGKVTSKVTGRYFRETAYQLLRNNGVEILRQTCAKDQELSIWPCLSLNPRGMADALFPEALYPGATLGEDGPGRPVRSTLGRTELMDRVYEIDFSVFDRLFGVPNG